MQNENKIFAPFIAPDGNEDYFPVFDLSKDMVESDIDYRVFERPINLPIDPEWVERALSFWKDVCNHLTISRGYCGHEWDCCGCFCGQTCRIVERDGNLFLRLSQSFNY